jgi:Tripartite tricarboxylate transporter family receptor
MRNGDPSTRSAFRCCIAFCARGPPPPGLPEPIVHLARSSRAVMTGPAIRERLAEVGFDPVGSTAREKQDVFAAEIPRWERIVRQGGMTSD